MQYKKNKKNILLLQLSRVVSCSNFFQVFVTCLPSSLKQEQCLKKVAISRPTASNLHNLFSTQYFCYQELGKSNSHLEKLFSWQIQTIIATKYYFSPLWSSQSKSLFSYIVVFYKSSHIGYNLINFFDFVFATINTKELLP